MPDFSVEVIEDKCLGTTSCVEVAPETFHIGPSGYVVAEDPPLNTLEEVVDAAKACPQEAIIVKDDSGARIFPPE